MKNIQIKISPKDLDNTEIIKKEISKKLKLKEEFDFKIVKKSLDARKRPPFFLLSIDIYTKNDKKIPEKNIIDSFFKVNEDKKVIIVGAGPAGYFCALELIEQGIKPVIFERGKDVNARRYDLRAIQQEGIVNPDSNYCFGEGGAGTYSDGKLYTRSTKRGDVYKVLKLLVEHGAKEDILIEAHPHIGSNKLPIIVKNIRETIIKFGGEVHFNSKVTDFLIENKKIIGVKVGDKKYFSDAVILATGHSSRDIFYLLRDKNIKVEFKPFAMGVRIEHEQKLIDKLQYGQEERELNLPASNYSLVCQVEGRGVFSFCMCPGGFIVPSSTAPEELVLNGMSLSKRDSKYANSGLVVSIEKEDLKSYEQYGEFAGLELQKEVEKKMFLAGDKKTQKAPAQRVIDFINNKISESLPKTSYIPGIYSAPLHEIIPVNIRKRLQEGLKEFDKKMKGYINENAQIIAIESRTSSPIRIPRNIDNLEHIEIENFYPCGEGAGYAGGIVSAAIDGQNCAKAFCDKIKK
ncbi:MAG: FAD-dependent oxidoreductase [Candidatus Sericytochromatia bacterium]